MTSADAMQELARAQAAVRISAREAVEGLAAIRDAVYRDRLRVPDWYWPRRDEFRPRWAALRLEMGR